MVKAAGTALALVGFLALVAAAAGWTLYQREPVRLLDLVDRVTGGTRSVEEVARLALGRNAAQMVRVFRAEGTPAGSPIVLFVHGGSWASGHPAHYGFVARSLAREGYVVALSGYRLGDDGRYPAMLEDTARAVAAVREEAARIGADRDRMFLIGHSAGAYNIVQTALEPRWLERAGVPPGAIAGIVGMAGPYDFFPFDGPATRAAFGHHPDGPATQPVNHVRGDAPPMLLLTGAEDTTVRLRNTRALADALEKAGSPVATRFYPGLSHADVLIHLASPWRGRHPAVRRDILEFLAEPPGTRAASVPVQSIDH